VVEKSRVRFCADLEGGEGRIEFMPLRLPFRPRPQRAADEPAGGDPGGTIIRT
jgi:hypothetical protein